MAEKTNKRSEGSAADDETLATRPIAEAVAEAEPTATGGVPVPVLEEEKLQASLRQRLEGYKKAGVTNPSIPAEE